MAGPSRAKPEAAVGAAESPEPQPPRARWGRRDALAGWGVSLVLHVLTLIGALVLTWPAQRHGDTGRPTERAVGLLALQDAPTIGGGPDRARIESFVGELAVPRLEDSTDAEAAWDLAASSRSPSRMERVIRIEVGSGGDVPAAARDDWTAFAAGAGGTGGGAATFFGLEARGRRFVFVVDRSGSMRGEKIDAAKAELLRAIRGLDRGAKFFTIFFSDADMPMPARDLVRATEASKRRHFTWVSGISAAGGTDPTAAMIRALSLKPDAVWLLSDGIFEASAADAIARANPGRTVQIHTIAFYSREGEAVLKRIAKGNRGRYRFVSPASIGLGAGR